MGQPRYGHAPGPHATRFDRGPGKLSISRRSPDTKKTERCTALGHEVCANCFTIRFSAERDVSGLQSVLAKACGLSFASPRKQDRYAHSSNDHWPMERNR